MSKKSVVVDIEASLDSGFVKAFDGAGARLNSLKGSIGDLERQAKQMSSFKEIKSVAKESVFAIKGFKNELRVLQNEISEQEKSGTKATKEQIKRQKQLERSVSSSTRIYDKNRQKLHSLREELTAAGIDTNRLSLEHKKLTNELDKNARAYKNLSRSKKFSDTSKANREKRNQAGSETVGAMASVVAAGAAMLNPLKFQHEMTRAYSLSDADEGQKKDLEGMAKFVASNYATTGVQAAVTEGVYAQSGFKPSEITGMLPATFDIVEATREDPDLVANLMGNVKTAFSMDASSSKDENGNPLVSEDMSFLANLLTKTANTSKASIESLAESSKYLLDKPKNFGLSASESMSYLATVGDFGLLDSMAGTSFGQLLDRLSQKPVQEKLKEAGINPYKTDPVSGQQVLQKPHEIALQWSERFSGVDKNNAELQALKTDIFQTQAWQFMGPLIEGIESGKFASHRENLSREKLGSSGSEKDYARIKREEMQDTAWGQALQVLSKLDAASLETFGPLEEDLKSTAISFQDTIEAYTNFAKNNKELVSSVLKATGAFIGFNVGIKASKFLFRAVTGGVFDLFSGFQKLRHAVDLVRKSEKLAAFWSFFHAKAKKSLSLVSSGLSLQKIKSNALEAKSLILSKASASWDFLVAKAKSARSFATMAAGASLKFFRLQNLKNLASQGLSLAAITASTVATGLATGAQWALNAAMSANPIGAVVTAVAALTAGGIWLYKNWSRLPQLFSKAWEKVKSFVMFWKDEDLEHKKPEIDTSSIDEFKKSGIESSSDITAEVNIKEPLTIPDQKIIDIIFNYPKPLFDPGPENNLIRGDFNKKSQGLNTTDSQALTKPGPLPWEKVKSFVMLWKDEDLEHKKPETDTSSIDEFNKSEIGSSSDITAEVNIKEPLTIPDQKTIDIIFNYPKPLFDPDPENNLIRGDFNKKSQGFNTTDSLPLTKPGLSPWDKISDLKYQKYQDIKDPDDKSFQSKGPGSYEDNRKVVIEKIVLQTSSKINEKKVAEMISEKLKEITNTSWGEPLYDFAEVS